MNMEITVWKKLWNLFICTVLPNEQPENVNFFFCIFSPCGVFSYKNLAKVRGKWEILRCKRCNLMRSLKWFFILFVSLSYWGLSVVLMKGSVLFICTQTSAQVAFGVFWEVSLVAAVMGGGSSSWAVSINPLLWLIPAQLRGRRNLTGMFSSLISTILVDCLKHPFPFCLPRARVRSVPVCHILQSPSHFPTPSGAPPDTFQDSFCGTSPGGFARATLVEANSNCVAWSSCAALKNYP